VMESRRILEEVYGTVPATFDFYLMRHELGAERIFWYDSILEVASVRDLETVTKEEVEKAQIKASDRQTFLESVQMHDGFLVRTVTSRGSIEKGRIRIREKEVDVLLAVDSLLHASRGNIRHAVILGADLDHRPLAEALMQLGVYVTIYGHARISKELRLSADSFRAFDYFVVSHWAESKWRSEQVEITAGGRWGGSAIVAEVGRGRLSSGEQLVLERTTASWDNPLAFQGYKSGLRETFACSSEETLKRFLAHTYGEAMWN
jgi:uncharacterized LabA/DUF88 family protein